jgi:hypothetical protein
MTRKYHRYVGGKANIRARCQACGLLLAFIRKPGKGGVLKWFPVNPDGTDHWDVCAQVRRRGSGMIRADGSVDFTKTRLTHPPRTTAGPKYVYRGDVPPWDESLGDFRDFTAEEIAAGIVCEPVCATDRNKV